MPDGRRIPRTGLSAYTTRALAQQGGVCPLCARSIPRADAVLDHDHATGEVRGVLHRSCNAAEGKVARAAGRWGAKSSAYSEILPWLKRLVVYLERQGHGVLHPAHKTEAERRAQRLLKARRARALQRAKAEMRSRGKQDGKD